MPKKRETSSERYKKTIRQRRIFVLSLFVIVVVLCICLFTPVFGISDISVSGNAVLSAEDIVSASGIQKGENVFRINTSKAEKNLMTLAYVEGVNVKRKFPAKIQIIVDEAEPEIILDTPTQFIVTTVKGRVLEVTDDVTHLTSPIVYGVEITGAEIAQTVHTEDEELFCNHLTYIQCFKETEHWENIDEFYVGDITNFMMVLKTGMKVTFGSIDSTDALQRKIKMMTKILEQVEQTEHSYLDLTTDKGYYGEYTDAELEEMERRANGEEIETEETEDIDSDTENTSEEEDTSDSEKEESKEKKSDDKTEEKTDSKNNKQDSSEKDKDSKKDEKPTESAKPSSKATEKPAEESEPRKKDSGEQQEESDEESENENTDDGESTTQDLENNE